MPRGQSVTLVSNMGPVIRVSGVRGQIIDVSRELSPLVFLIAIVLEIVEMFAIIVARILTTRDAQDCKVLRHMPFGEEIVK